MFEPGSQRYTHIFRPLRGNTYRMRKSYLFSDFRVVFLIFDSQTRLDCQVVVFTSYDVLGELYFNLLKKHIHTKQMGTQTKIYRE